MRPAPRDARGGFTSVRSMPFDRGNPAARDDPVANDAVAHWPAFQEAERANKNNFCSAHAWKPKRNFWTERHAAFKLLASVVAYEVAGDAASRDAGLNHWIRPSAAPAATAFRVSPHRKWGWERRTSDGLAFALQQTDQDALFSDGFEAP